MKQYFIALSILSCCMLTACDDQIANSTDLTQSNTRAIHIAGMPVDDQSFRLNAQVQTTVKDLER